MESKKATPQAKQLLRELQNYALELTERGHDAFFNFSGHTMGLDFSLHINGWGENQDNPYYPLERSTPDGKINLGNTIYLTRENLPTITDYINDVEREIASRKIYK